LSGGIFRGAEAGFYVYGFMVRDTWDDFAIAYERAVVGEEQIKSVASMVCDASGLFHLLFQIVVVGDL